MISMRDHKSNFSIYQPTGTSCTLVRKFSLVVKNIQLIRPEKYRYSKCGPIHNLRITTKILQRFPPLSSIWPLGRNYYTVMPITQSIRPENYKCLKCGPIPNLNMTTKMLQGVLPLGSLCPLGWHYYPVIPITQSTFFCLRIGTVLGEGGWSALLLLSLI